MASVVSSCLQRSPTRVLLNSQYFNFFVIQRCCLPACVIVSLDSMGDTGAILSHWLRRIFNGGRDFFNGVGKILIKGENFTPWLCLPSADISWGRLFNATPVAPSQLPRSLTYCRHSWRSCRTTSHQNTERKSKRCWKGMTTFFLEGLLIWDAPTWWNTV